MTTLLNSNNSSVNQTSFKGYQQFIASSRIDDLIQKVKPVDQQRKLIDLPVTATIEEALDILLANDIRSVPIYQYTVDNKKEYVKIVSALDLLRLLSTQITADTAKLREDVLLITLKEAIHFGENVAILKSSDSLDKLIKWFTIEHRVLIEQQEPLNYLLLTQMDLIQYFQLENHRLGSELLDLSVSDIKPLGVHSIVNFKITAIEAFLKLGGDNRLSALPIVDDLGEFVTELSASDLRGLNRERWSSLSKPVVMYLKESHGDLLSPKTCHDQFTLSQILTAFALRKADKLWWINSTSGQLQGVITLTDIISTFASHF
ncbi:hypothetical protein G6F37_004562 [Rhizopus arrhizus]|nr:hypothetical protein G6F38_002392 [Rhizopus arrhizus]KAG1159801.1 hypothetical protein G6F37_004562 [Rhizopus arrhizus]